MTFTTKAWVWKFKNINRWAMSTQRGNYWTYPTWTQAMHAANIAVSIPDEAWRKHRNLIDGIIRHEVPERYAQLLDAADEGMS